MLLILNKVAVTYLPAPSFILLAQLSSVFGHVNASEYIRRAAATTTSGGANGELSYVRDSQPRAGP
jgi:hypothetical protein